MDLELNPLDDGRPRTEDSLEQKIRQAEAIIEDLDLDDDYLIKPFTDFDGPVKTRGSGSEEYHDGVAEAFQMLVEDEHVLNPGIISGRGTAYLLGQVERMGLEEIDLAGEMGALYFTQEEFEGETPDSFDASRTIPEDEESMQDIYAFNLHFFEQLADYDLQMMYGDNMSNVIGSACVEAVGINLDEDRFSISDTVYEDIYDHASAQSVQEQIRNYMEGEYADNFEFQNDMIRFKKNLESAEVLTDVFMANPFIPWGFHDEGDMIAIFPEYRSREEFSKDMFDDFVTTVVERYNQEADTEFWASTYGDHSFDFGKKGYENLKTRAALEMAPRDHMEEDILLTNTGDKPTDILDTSNSLFFAQSGTSAQQYCEENDIPYVEVDDAAEAFHIQSEVATR